MSSVELYLHFPNTLSWRGKKAKAKSCPCALTEHHAMKTYWGSGDIHNNLHSSPVLLVYLKQRSYIEQLINSLSRFYQL